MQAPPEDTGNEDTGEDTGEVVPVEPAGAYSEAPVPVSYTHLRAHET